MPEGTLVTNISFQAVRYGFALCLVIVLQTGCSPMKPPSLRELVDHRRSPTNWEVEKEENLARLFEENPEAFEPLTAESAIAAGQAEMATNLTDNPDAFQQTQSDETPRLTAVPTNQEQAAECITGQCNHPGCHHGSPKATPKLPYAEPIEPPAAAKTAPPAAVVSQPLTPMGHDHPTAPTDHNAELSDSVGEDTGDSSHLAEQPRSQTTSRRESNAEINQSESRVIRLETPQQFQESATPVSPRMAEELAATEKTNVPPNAADDDASANANRAEGPVSTINSDSTSGSQESQRRNASPENTDSPPAEEITVDPGQFEGQEAELENIPPFADCPPPDSGAGQHDQDMIAPSHDDAPEESEFLTENQSDQFLPSSTNADNGDSTCDICGARNCTTCRLASQSDANSFQSPVLPTKDVELAPPMDHASDSQTIALATHLQSATDFAPELETDASDFEPAAQFEPALDANSNPTNWQAQIEESIRLVEQQLSSEADPELRNGHQVNLQLLGVLKRNIQHVSTEQQSQIERNTWQVRLDAISAMLQNQDLATENAQPIPEQKLAEGLDCLRRAVEQLEAMAGLQLGNASFCTEVKGFGQVTPFASHDFRPSEKVLVYCEVENYKSSEVETVDAIQYLTRLQGSFAILDKQGRVVQQGRFPVVEDVALSKRRDFYMYFPIEFANLSSGDYRLDLEAEDLTANSSAAIEPSLSFTIQ